MVIAIIFSNLIPENDDQSNGQSFIKKCASQKWFHYEMSVVVGSWKNFGLFEFIGVAISSARRRACRIQAPFPLFGAIVGVIRRSSFINKSLQIVNTSLTLAGFWRFYHAEFLWRGNQTLFPLPQHKREKVHDLDTPKIGVWMALGLPFVMHYCMQHCLS